MCTFALCDPRFKQQPCVLLVLSVLVDLNISCVLCLRHDGLRREVSNGAELSNHSVVFNLVSDHVLNEEIVVLFRFGIVSDEFEQFEEVFAERIFVLEQQQNEFLSELCVAHKVVFNHELLDVFRRLPLIDQSHNLLELLSCPRDIFLLR